MGKQTKSLTFSPQLIEAIKKKKGILSFSAFCEVLLRDALLTKYGVMVQPYNKERSKNNGS